MQRLATILILFFCFTQASYGQQQSETGLPVFGSFHGSNFDNVNLVTGNLHIEIPIISVPQRETPNLAYKFMYDIRSWQITKSQPTPTTFQWNVAPTSGEFVNWNLVTDPAHPVSYRYDAVPKTCSYFTGYTWVIVHYNVLTNYVVVDNHGTRHPFDVRHTEQPASGCFDPNPDIQTGMALDGSGITLDIGTNGHTIKFVWADDIGQFNGNALDTLGRQTISPPDWTIYDSNGNPQQFRVDYAQVNIQTNLCGTLSPCFEDTGVSNLPQKLTLPDGRFYQFTWSTDGNADLLRIDLPTGGYLAYSYATSIRQGPLPTDGRRGIWQYIARRSVTSRTVSDGTTANTWTYSGGTVRDPLGNEEVHVFGFFTNPDNDPQGTGRYETQIRTYQGTAASGTLLRTVNKDYLGEIFTPEPDQIDHGTINVRVIRETTILEDGTQSKAETDFEMVPQRSGYNVTRLNLIEKREYDFGAGAPGPLKRKTDYTYLHTGNQNYLSRNITKKVLTTTVFDGSGTQVAKTVNEYDNYTHAGLPMQPSNAVQHNATYSTSFIYRGNVTAVSHWRNTDNAMLTTVHQYDDAGNVIATVDTLNHKTTFDYTDSWSNATCAPAAGGQGKAYVTSITDAAGHATTKKYNSCTGSLASTTDPNLQTTSTTYDLMGRPSQLTLPDGGLSTWCYTDVQTGACYNASSTIQAQRTDKISITPTVINKIQTSVFDGLGRITQTQLNSDPSGVTYVDTTYDANGRKYTASNPYRTTGETTYGITTFNYDPLDRTTSVVEPDGGTLTTSYAANCTTVADEAGKARKSCTDGLGRLTQVLEDPTTLNYQTLYQYDTLGNLTCVEQHGSATTGTGCSAPPSSDATSPWRVRRFTYNSLSQLLNATNPESGTISYAYDNGGNLLTKTAPKPNQQGALTVASNYSYDVLNRLTQKSYNDGSTPTVKYGYDGVALSGCTPAPPTVPDSYPVGRSTSMCDGSGATSWSHEQMGRVATESRTIAGSTNITKTITYAPYNLDGSLANVTYPSGRIITYAPGGAGRPLSAIETAHSLNYVTSATYAPQGALSGMQNGASISGRLTYNARLQPQQIYYTSGTVPTPDQLQLACPTTAATILSRLYNFGAGTNNGNVQTITDCLVTNRTQNFDYDGLNRLADAYTTGNSINITNWGEVYTIDPWGNLTNIALKPGWQHSELLNAAAASPQNQLNGFCYDAAGNMTGPAPCPSSIYTYDAENRLIATAEMSYRYDGDGKRVEKCTQGTTPGTCAATATGTLYWTGTGSDALAETDWTGAAVEKYVFFGGKRMARRDGTGNTVHYYFADHLGSTDVITGALGSIQKNSVYYPFGGEIAVTAPSFANNYKFTGKERDAETGNDYFGARYYSASLGRFMTPDWAAKPVSVPYASFGDPQSLNLYAYVGNNPLSRADLDGHLCGVGVFNGGVATGANTGCVEKEHAPKPGAQEKTLGQRFKSMFYAYASITFGVHAKVGPARVDLRAGFEKHMTSDETTRSHIGAIGAKVEFGGKEIGLAAKHETVIDRNGKPANDEHTDIVFGYKGSGSEEVARPSAHELGIGLGAIFGGEVGVRTDKVAEFGSAVLDKVIFEPAAKSLADGLSNAHSGDHVDDQ